VNNQQKLLFFEKTPKNTTYSVPHVSTQNLATHPRTDIMNGGGCGGTSDVLALQSFTKLVETLPLGKLEKTKCGYYA